MSITLDLKALILDSGGGYLDLSNFENETYIDVSHSAIYQVGEYKLDLDDTALNRENRGGGRIRNQGKTYFTFEQNMGELEILRLDTINQIISGTFQFDAINEDDITDTIKIREGRFDVKFTR